MCGMKACNLQSATQQWLVAKGSMIQWPVEAGVVHCTLSGHAWGHTQELAVIYSVWFCGWPPLALKGAYSPCFWDCTPAVSWSTVGTTGDLLPSRRCLSVFSFSPFLVKGSGSLKGTGQVASGRERGSQSSHSSRNTMDSALQCLNKKDKCLFLDKLWWMLLSLYMSSSLYFVQKAAVHYIIATGMESSAMGLFWSHQRGSMEQKSRRCLGFLVKKAFVY